MLYLMLASSPIAIITYMTGSANKSKTSGLNLPSVNFVYSITIAMSATAAPFAKAPTICFIASGCIIRPTM